MIGICRLPIIDAQAIEVRSSNAIKEKRRHEASIVRRARFWPDDRADPGRASANAAAMPDSNIVATRDKRRQRIRRVRGSIAPDFTAGPVANGIAPDPTAESVANGARRLR
jgi:hypothetical protein